MKSFVLFALLTAGCAAQMDHDAGIVDSGSRTDGSVDAASDTRDVIDEADATVPIDAPDVAPSDTGVEVATDVGTDALDAVADAETDVGTEAADSGPVDTGVDVQPADTGPSCTWVTVADCDTGGTIRTFCPGGGTVHTLRRCDTTTYTPDDSYLDYHLCNCTFSGCGCVGVAWSEIECCN